jgi:hypothetical protein
MPLRWLQRVSRDPVIPLAAARRSGLATGSIHVRRLIPEELQSADLVTYRVDDYWLEHVIDNRWIAAFRFTLQDGQAVISEMRIFPADGDSTMAPAFLLSEVSDRSPGQWSAEFAGHKAKAPRGGLTATLVHNSVKLGEIMKNARVDLNTLRRETPSLFEPAGTFAQFTAKATRAAMSERRPGRKGHGLLFFAQLAKDYVDQIRASDPRPAATIARARGLKPERVRDFIHRARKQGLLTDALLPGQKSGELTPKALAILKTVRSRRQNVPANMSASTRKGTTSAPRQPTRRRKTPR